MALLSRISEKSKISINSRLILRILKKLNNIYPYFIRIIKQKNIDSKDSYKRKFLFVFIFLLLPISVSAGLVSIIKNNILNKDTEIYQKSEEKFNSMDLFVSNINPTNSDGNFDIPTIENDALVSNRSNFGVIDTNLSNNQSDQISIYVIRKGDTLSQIAEMFDVSVNTIKWGNDLDSNTLKEGETLVILPISGVKHTILKGETISSIAKKYNADVKEIMDYNNITEKDLYVGLSIIIPDGEVSSSSNVNYNTKTNQNTKDTKGFFARPVAGGKKTQGIHGHNGIDIASYHGAEIFASADGVVIISKNSGWNGGYGNYIVIKHKNGTQTLYAHNSKNLVSVGDSVKQGDLIGLMGSTGKSTGVHLHFEIRGAKNPF